MGSERVRLPGILAHPYRCQALAEESGWNSENGNSPKSTTGLVFPGCGELLQVYVAKEITCTCSTIDQSALLVLHLRASINSDCASIASLVIIGDPPLRTQVAYYK